MSEAFIPLEYRGVRYESSQRPCDDPFLNFQRIRNAALWEAHEAKQREAEKKSWIASGSPKR